MSTGVNEYPLSQSLGNPANKMPPLIDKICHNTKRETSGIQLSTTEGFFTLWCLSRIPLFLYLQHWNWVQLLLGDLLPVVAMKQSTSCLIYPPVHLHCFCLILSVFLSSTPSFVLSPFFTLPPPLSLWSSSPPRCEQVIGWSPSYNPFVVGKCIFYIFIIHNLNLHFKTLLISQKFGRPGYFILLWIFRFINLGPWALYWQILVSYSADLAIFLLISVSLNQ